MDKIFVATLTTRNFHFEAFGTSAESARNVLIDGLVIHGRQYRMADRWYAKFESDIELRERSIHAAFRDGEELKP